MAPLLDARGVSFAYNTRAILRDLSLSVNENEVVGLVGPNGVGKTTLLRIILGLLRPHAGRVALCGAEVTALRRREIALRVAFVPQDSRIDFAFTVREVVAMGRNPYLGRFRPEGAHDLDAVQQALEQTETAALAERAADTLSGGEQQRVLVARALAQETPIILLDEPTANLDLAHQLEVMTLVRRLAGGGRCALAAIHDLSLASRYCDRIVVLYDGAIAADGPPTEVLTPANLARFFGVQADIRPAAAGRGLTVVPLDTVRPEAGDGAGHRGDTPPT